MPSSRIDESKLAHLSPEQKHEFLTLLDESADIFDEKPGLCKVDMHETRAAPGIKPNVLRPT